MDNGSSTDRISQVGKEWWNIMKLMLADGGWNQIDKGFVKNEKS